MNFKVVVAHDPFGLFHSTVYVDAPDIVRAIKAAESHLCEETAADPARLFTISASLADAQRIIKARVHTIDCG